jgi:hypothetical protein
MPSFRPARRLTRLVLCALVPACVAGARTAHAQGEVAAAWLDCAPSGSHDLPPQCLFNIGERRLVLSITPDADVSQVVGWTLVLDLAPDSQSLPDWWALQPGGCREGQLVTAMPTGLENNCIDVWSAAGSPVIQGWTFPGPEARHLRFVVGVGVAPSAAFSLTAGESYLAGILALHFAKTASPGECVGCAEPACIVFNSAELARLPGAPGPAPGVFVTPSPSFGNQVTWGDGTACASVPARNRTWGQIKSLYR